MRPAFVRGLTRQGWGASRGIKGGSAPLARSYRGPDNVAGPIVGHLNPALAVVDAVLVLPKPEGYQRGTVTHQHRNEYT